jgi:TPR repeat protein
MDAALASVHPDQPQALLLRGLRLVAMGGTNTPAGLMSLERAMQRGEPRAAAILAVLKSSGAPGLPRDLDAARQLLERAAAVGDPAAARVLGEGYLSGWSGHVDPAAAARHLRAAAERGDVPAMLRLADMYLRGTGVDKNEGEAERLLTAAARRGHAEAQALLGTWRLVAYGNGLTDDPTQALEWLERAADKAHPKALYQLGMFYVEYGRRTGQLDLSRGVALFARCVEESRDADCLFAYASALDYGLGTPRDPVKAHVMYGLLQPLNPSVKVQRRRDELARTLGPADLARAEAEVSRLMQMRDVARSTVSLPQVGRGFGDVVRELRTDATRRDAAR